MASVTVSEGVPEAIMRSVMYSGTLRPTAGCSISGGNTLMPMPTHTPPPQASREMPQSLRYSSARSQSAGMYTTSLGHFS